MGLSVSIATRERERKAEGYEPPRDVPEVEIEFVPSTERPVSLGEPATTASPTGDQ